MVIGALGAPVAAATVIYAMRIVVYGAGIEGYGVMAFCLSVEFFLLLNVKRLDVLS